MRKTLCRREKARHMATGSVVWMLSAMLVWPAQAVTITEVVHGQVQTRAPQIQADGRVLTEIVQSSARAIVHASDFNIAPNHIVNVVQPNPSAWMLARVFGPATRIDGTLTANGSLILLNPNGVFIGPTGQVSVGGMFAASTLTLSNANFLNGLYLFQDSGTNGIIRNAGTINAGVEGVYLFAPTVENAATGIITSTNGHVSLGAGRTAFLSNRPDGRGFLSEVTAPADQALNLGQLLADGGQVTMAGRVVNQSGIIRANSVLQRNGRIELVASEQVNVTAGSQTVSRGSEAGAHGGTVIAKAATRDQHGTRIGGTVSVESGAMVDVTPGSGGVAGEVWLGGTAVVQNGSLVGAVHRLIPNQVTLGDGELLALAAGMGRAEINVLAMDDVTVASSMFLDMLGPQGVFNIEAGRNVTFSNGTFSSLVARWNILGRAGQDLTVHASEVGTGGGAGIHLHAGRDLALVDGPLEFARVNTALTGGDISLSAARDIIASSPFERYALDRFSLPGIHVGLPGNLTMRAGQDLRGPAPLSQALKPRGFGFTLQGGIADVAAGRDIGSEQAPVNLILGGRIDNGDGTFTVPAAVANLNAGRSLFFSLAEDFGLREFGFLTANGSTSNSGTVLRTQVNLTARTGDILIQPDRPTGNFAEARRLLPAQFSARADEGSIVMVTETQPLRFWPSAEGNIQFHARHEIKGQGRTQLLPDENSVLIFTGLPSDPRAQWVRVDRNVAVQDPFLAQWLARWGDLSYIAGLPPDGLPPNAPPAPMNLREKPLIAQRPNTPALFSLYPGDVRALIGQDVQEFQLDFTLANPPSNPMPPGARFGMTTELGDISGLQLALISPLLRQTAISSGRDIKGILVTGISTPRLPNGEPSAIIHAAGSINLSRVRGFTTSGITFLGDGTAQVRANGNIDLGDSFGIVHRLGLTQATINQRQRGGLLDIGAGGNIEMTQSQIATLNGGSIFIHGADGVRIVDAAGSLIPGAADRALLIDRSGTSLLALPGQSGTPAPVQAYKTTLVVDQAALSQTLFTTQDVVNGRVELVWKPLFVEQTGQLLLVGGQRVKQGDQIAFNQKIVLADLNPARASDGGATLSNGRPALVDGKLLVQIDGRIVPIVSPVGGKVNIGGTVVGGNAEQTGVLTLRGGDIQILSTGDVDVNRSRVGTFYTGNIEIKSTAGSINAGSGSKNERSLFVIDNGVGQPPTLATVPGSGIFTWHPDDPDLTTLPFPEFKTPEMKALEARIVKRRFLGRDSRELEAEYNRLNELRTIEYDVIFEHFIQNVTKANGTTGPLELGDVNLIAARNIDVPEAGIRGRRINLEAGESLNLLGGSIIGKTTFSAASISGSLGAFAGAAAGSAGGASVSAAGGAGGSSVGGLSGATATVSATASATGSTSSTASKSVEQVQQSTTDAVASSAPTAGKQMADKSEQKGGKSSMAKSVQMKRGVVIQVDVKPQATSQVQPGG